MSRLTRIVLTLVTLAPALPAVANDWIMHSDLTEGQFEGFIENNIPPGYRPVSVNGHGSHEAKRFAIVAVEDPGVPWYAEHQMESDTYQERAENLLANGYRILSVDGYGNFPDYKYVAAWVKDGLPPEDWAAVHGKTSAELDDRHEELKDLGFRMTWLSGYGNGGNRRYAAVWKRNDEGWSTRVTWSRTPIEYEQYRRDRLREGYRPIVVTAYDTNDPQYGGIFLRPDGPNWEIQPQWHETQGQSHVQLTVTAFDFDDTWYQPSCVVGYGDSDDLRYASTWFEDTPAPVFGVTGLNVPSLSNFDLAMEQFMTSRKIGRASLAVTKDNRLVLQRAYTNAAPGVTLTEVTDRFRIASVSKPFTAIATLQLIEDGLIGENGETFQQRLDTRLVDIPGFDGQGWSDARFDDVTVRHLLQHRGGWDRDVSFDPLFRDFVIADTLDVPLPIGPQHIIQYMKDIPLDFTPGTDFAYANFGYFLLGQVIEAVTGQAYDEYVRENVLCPIGAQGMQPGRSLLEDRLPDETDYRDPMNRYDDDVTGGLPLLPKPYGTFNVENRNPNGGWVATSTELARFVSDFTLAATSELLTGTSINFMWTATVESGGAWGAGWRLTNSANYHNGSLPGTWAYIIRRPDGVTISVVFNQRSSDAETPVQDDDWEIRTALMDVADLVGGADWPAHDLFDDNDCDSRDWGDGFDSYPVGPLAGRGGWEPWDDDPAFADFMVTDAAAHGAPQSVAIDRADDAVRRFDVEEGRWLFTAWLFVPAAMDDLQHLILLNTYPAGPLHDWSLQLQIDGANGLLADRNGAAQLPLVKGAWSRVQVDIDLEADIQTVTYDGRHLLTKSWTDGVGEGGATAIAAVDLYATGSVYEVYYDDLSLVEIEETPCPADLDGDGQAGFGDILAVLAAWGPCSGCPEDIDGDGQAGFGDILSILAAWGPCP